MSHIEMTVKPISPEAQDGIALALARGRAMREHERRLRWALVLFAFGLGMACYHAWLSVTR